MAHTERHRADLADEVFRRGDWVYLRADDYEYDDATGRRMCRKLIHVAVNSDTGRTVEVDFTPYAEISPETFDHLIALDFPGRQGPGPLDAAEVEAMAREAA